LLELLQLKRAGTIDGLDRVVEIGAQQLANSFLQSRDLLDQLYELAGRPYAELGTPEFVGMAAERLEHLPNTAPPARLFWESLGFSYAAIDFGGHRNSIPVDLNRDQVSEALCGTFHLAVNAGTTEHIANQDNAFRVIHDLVCRGGIMIHEVPAQGMMNHGLINYNPKFFWHLCRENNYEVLSMVVTSGAATPVPENILESNRTYGRTLKTEDNGKSYIDSKIAKAVPDFAIRTSLRKVDDRPFVTPLDLPTD
jgi:hypothetical protein